MNIIEKRRRKAWAHATMVIRELVMEHDMPDREISRMTGRSVRAIQVMRHKMRKAGEVRTGV